MSDAVILDRGYRHYDGQRYGRRGATRAIVREGIRRILGLRRKARRKIFPWTVIAITFIGVAILLGIHFARAAFLGGIDLELPQNGELFDFTSVIWLLFIAFAAPELLIPDRTQGVLSVYFSRPLLVSDYLLGKVGAIAFLVLGAYLVPQVALHLGLASLSDEGFLPYLGDNLDVLWQMGATALVYFAMHASVALTMAALIPRRGFAAGAFLGVMLVATPIIRLLATSDLPAARWLSFLALERHPRVVRDWWFDITTESYITTELGFEPWMSLAATILVTAVAGVVIYSRYRKLA